MGYELESHEGAGEGIVRAITERLDHALVQFDCGGDFDEAVHTARKDLKKARSAIAMVRSTLGKKRYRAADVKLRDAGRKLSDARDTTVLGQTLDALGDHFDEEIDVHATQALAVWSKSLWAVPVAEQAGADGPERAVELISEARDSIAEWRLPGGWSLLEPGLTRSYRLGRGGFREIGNHPADEELHEWRKRVKDLWYQLRLLRPIWPGVLGETIDEAHELANLLGDHHDLSLLRPGLDNRELLAEGPARALGQLVETRRQQLLAQAFPLGERIYAEKPKAFERRLHVYWKTWRSRSREKLGPG
jgi:CHAD domain-containing protein